MQLGFIANKEFEPISPLNEMAAYEALWDEQGASFKSIAQKLANSSVETLANLVEPDRLAEYKHRALQLLSDSDIGDFGIRVHGAAEYPEMLRDAKWPVELLYYLMGYP